MTYEDSLLCIEKWYTPKIPRNINIKNLHGQLLFTSILKKVFNNHESTMEPSIVETFYKDKQTS